jgi:hypothetical protein
MPFSMLTNSEFLDQDAILKSAERCLGHKELYAWKLYASECAKTEFLSEEEEKHRSCYWIKHARDTNDLCVLPSKLTFSPAVAHQTYPRLKDLLHLEDVVDHPPYSACPTSEQFAKMLVAAPYPV